MRARLPLSWEDRSISDRCITRRMLGALPTLYGNGLRIVQTPGYIEGNDALKNILSAARAEERAADEAIRKGMDPPAPSAWQGNTGLLPTDPSFGRPR